MSFTEFLLEILSLSHHDSYRELRKKLHCLPEDAYFLKKRAVKFNKIKDSSFRTILWRLKKRGFVENKNKLWSITEKGRKFLKSVFRSKPIDEKSYDKGKKIIIIFDIPEEYKKKRWWLRSQLILMEFKMLQKSVWIGPSPLPEDFIRFLKDLSLLRFVKFFRISSGDLV